MSIKQNLAYAYQILAKLDMADHTYTHLSARSEESGQYYINPFGLIFNEITEDNLLKADFDGNVIEGEEFQYNKTGYVIHSGIYKARKDINAIFHLHTVSTVAVSATKLGLMPISQWAMHFYKQINYHNYNSLALDNEMHGKQLANDLGDKKVMFLRNHGFIACGSTIHEALFYCHHLELACKAQIAALSTGMELIIPDEDICMQANADLLSFEKDLGIRDWHAWIRWLNKK